MIVTQIEEILIDDILHNVMEYMHIKDVYSLYKTTNNVLLKNKVFNVGGPNNCLVCGIDLDAIDGVGLTYRCSASWIKLCSRGCAYHVCDYGF